MTLTKNDLVDAVTKMGFTKKKSAEIVETCLELIKKTLATGEDVLISGFCKFCVKEKKQRKGRNPQTGEDIVLSERRVVTFNSSPVLREKINRGT
jgi:integration host factor subunit alpha